jgi:uncharacterized protein (TIGR00297 family)
MTQLPAYLIAGLVLSTVIAIVGVRTRALTVSGGIAAIVVGTATLGFGGGAVAAAVIGFFLSGSVLSRVGGERARTARAMAQKGSTRDAVQVFANGGVGAACSLCAALWPVAAPAWVAAAVGSLIAVSADTWSTEIGVLSKAPPRSIVNGRIVAPGTSGGVSMLGYAASVAGGAAIGALASLFAPSRPVLSWLVGGAIVGLIGATIDSLLGASVQSAWRCDACGESCESGRHQCGAATRRVRGVAWIDNDAVNALTAAAGGVLGWCVHAVAHGML